MAAVFSSCAVGLDFGKKTGAKYSANAEYAYQSYHSTRLPMEPETMERSGDAELAGVGIAAKVAARRFGQPPF